MVVSTFNFNALKEKRYAVLVLIVLWPYFGFYSELFYQVSIVLLTFLLIVLTDKNTKHLIFYIIIAGMIIFCIGQLIHGIQFSGIREIIRALLLPLGFSIGYLYRDKLPFLILVIPMAMLVFISKFFHPNIPVLSNIYAINPEFTDSYHYFRTTMFGGMPATSGYVFAFVAVWGALMLTLRKLKFSSFIIGYSMILILTISTLSRLSIIFAVGVPFFILLVNKSSIKYAITIIISFSLVIINLLNFGIIEIPDRWLSYFSALHRIGTIGYIFNLIGDDVIRILPGCMFVRECHYDGTIRSISTDGGLLYLFLNWGFFQTSFLLIISIFLIVNRLLAGCYAFCIILVSGLVFSLFDPVITDPKTLCMWAISLGYTFKHKFI